MENNNYFKLEFEAKNTNESFARGVVAMFASELKPTLSEVNDLKTAVSEAVTNSIVHGYGSKGGKIILETKIVDNKIGSYTIEEDTQIVEVVLMKDENNDDEYVKCTLSEKEVDQLYNYKKYMDINLIVNEDGVVVRLYAVRKAGGTITQELRDNLLFYQM